VPTHAQEDTISINHNWLNGANIRAAWQHVVDERAAAHRAMQGFDFDGMPNAPVKSDACEPAAAASSTTEVDGEEWERVETVQRASCGMGMRDFHAFLLFARADARRTLDTATDALDRWVAEESLRRVDEVLQDMHSRHGAHIKRQSAAAEPAFAKQAY
jgi:hypothetical protein